MTNYSPPSNHNRRPPVVLPPCSTPSSAFRSYSPHSGRNLHTGSVPVELPPFARSMTRKYTLQCPTTLVALTSTLYLWSSGIASYRSSTDFSFRTTSMLSPSTPTEDRRWRTSTPTTVYTTSGVFPLVLPLTPSDTMTGHIHGQMSRPTPSSSPPSYDIYPQQRSPFDTA